MPESLDVVRQALALQAKRLGIALGEDELAALAPVCLRQRELLARLRAAIPAQAEPSVSFPQVSDKEGR